MKKPSPLLVNYIEAEIIPRYASFDRAHGIDHVRTVIAQSLALAAHYDVDPDKVYIIAAFHDTGLCRGRELHHLYSSEILASDPQMMQWFPAEELALMCEAVEDHRASSERTPRSIYGRIVAEADRVIDPQTIVRRTVQYGLDRCPALNREGHFARCREHLQRKYAEGGYLRLWIPQSENAARLETLRDVLRNEERLRALFDAIYDRETDAADGFGR